MVDDKEIIEKVVKLLRDSIKYKLSRSEIIAQLFQILEDYNLI